MRGVSSSLRTSQRDDQVSFPFSSFQPPLILTILVLNREINHLSREYSSAMTWNQAVRLWLRDDLRINLPDDLRPSVS